MHKQGHIQRWDADRGFGFIRGQGADADIFFHIKDYRGARAPAQGDRVWFEEIHVGGKGPRAMAVRTDAEPAGARGQTRSTHADVSRPAAPSARTLPRRAVRPPPSSGHSAAAGGGMLGVFCWLALLLSGVWAALQRKQRIPSGN